MAPQQYEIVTPVASYGSTLFLPTRKASGVPPRFPKISGAAESNLSATDWTERGRDGWNVYRLANYAKTVRRCREGKTNLVVSRDFSA